LGLASFVQKEFLHGLKAARRSTVIRFILVATILTGGLIVGREVWPEFINLPSLLITVGGTLTVTLLTFSWTQICELGKALYSLSTEEWQTLEERIAELERLAHLYRLEGPRGLESQEDNIADPFLGRGIGMVADLHREEDIRQSLESEFSTFFSRYEVARQILLMVGKLLPAFGLIGTLIGFVLLLHQISSLDPHTLASALSIAVLTTLYGALLANVVVLPLAAKLHSFGHEREAIMRFTLEGVVLLARGEAPSAIERRLSALLPSTQHRQGWEGAWGSGYRPAFSLQRPVLSQVER
jgi:chemotaxis protein MotA